jgi:lipid-A-disaccharide synthase
MRTTQRTLLIAAGEPSGDRIAAAIATVARRRDIRCVGMGGAAGRAAGVELVADLSDSAAMGFTEVASRLPAVLRAYRRLVRAARDLRPAAAVLVDYVEFNLRLGRRLRALGVPVLWCVAPQVWAWRAARRDSARTAMDRLATILPFEPAIWREAGVDAHYIGHPALDARCDRETARRGLGIAGDVPAVALLPGSRAHEVKRLAEPMLDAVRAIKRERPLEVHLLAAPWLDARTRAWLDAAAGAHGVPVIDVDPVAGAMQRLPAFDAALTASGTASLECALAGALPVVVYRVSALTAAIARRLLKTPHIALPNVVLGERIFPELLQSDAEPCRMAVALRQMLERGGERADWVARLTTRMRVADGGDIGERAFALLDDWLGGAPARQAPPETRAFAS